MNIPHGNDDAELHARFGDAFSEISSDERRRRIVVVGPDLQSPRRRRSSRSIPKIGAAAAALLVIGGVVFAHQALAPSAAPRPSGTASTVYTAAMVERMANATRAAVAHSGLSQVTFRITLSGDRDKATVQYATGDESTTFSGSDIAIGARYSMHPANPDGSAAYSSATLRIIGGSEYGLYKGAWYLFPTAPSSVEGMLQPDTDPRTFLRALSPAADFQMVDRETVGGSGLTHLRAENRNLTIPIQETATLSQPQGDGKDIVTKYVMAYAMRVSSLDVWVDRAGIVHRMDLTSSVDSNSMSTVPATDRPSNWADLADTMTQVMTITFSHLGDHETISTPSDVNTQPPAGCSDILSCADPRYPMIPPSPLLPAQANG